MRGALVTRPMQRFNIDSRTEKLLARDKPIQAPKFQSDRELLEEIRRDRPEIVEAAIKKDDKLLQRLNSVFVTSQDPDTYDPDINRTIPDNPNRPKPAHGQRGFIKPGFEEAAAIMGAAKPGKLAIDDLQTMLAVHSSNPTSNTTEALAKEYKYEFCNVSLRNQ